VCRLSGGRGLGGCGLRWRGGTAAWGWDQDQRWTLDYAGLVTAAHHQLPAPVILIWDDLNTHISAAMRAFTGAHPDWLTQARLPACAPDLNAVEGAWANMKNGLGNLAAADVDRLTAIIKNRLKASSTGPASSTHSSPQPGSPSNQNRRRPQPFNLCSWVDDQAVRGLVHAWSAIT
jgi:hypothetical protein